MPGESILLNRNTNVLPAKGTSHFTTPSVKQASHMPSLLSEYNNNEQGSNTPLKIPHLIPQSYAGYTLKY